MSTKNIQHIISKKIIDIKQYLNNNYDSELEFYKHFIQIYNTNDNPYYNKNDFYINIINHSYKVLQLCEQIIQYHEHYWYKKYTIEEKYIVRIGAIFHDIGKLVMKEKHSKWGYIILNELLTLEFNNYGEIRIKDYMATEILSIVKNYTKKDKRRDEISDLVKIVRDADTMDENCGDSLVLLAISYIENNKDLSKMNLNKINYTKSDKVMEYKMSNEMKSKVKELINIPINYDFYIGMLNYANEQYDILTNFHRHNNKYKIHILNNIYTII